MGVWLGLHVANIVFGSYWARNKWKPLFVAQKEEEENKSKKKISNYLKSIWQASTLYKYLN